MEKYERKAIFSELKEYCHLAKENDFIEITEWKNGEGYDIHIYSSGTSTFPLTYGQFKAIKKLIKKLNK